MQLKEAWPARAPLCPEFSPESWPKPAQVNLPLEWDWVSASESSDGEWEDLAERPLPSGEAVKSWRDVVLLRPSLLASRTTCARACEDLSSHEAASCVKDDIYGRIDERVNDGACSCQSSVCTDWTEPCSEPDMVETVEMMEAEKAFPWNPEYVTKLKLLRGRAWSEDYKFWGLHGASAARKIDFLRETEVERAPHKTEDGDVLYPVTELELELGLHQHNLNKKRAWERCAELVGKTGIQMKARTHKEQLAEVSFSLPTVGFFMMPSAESFPASSHRQRTHQSFMLHEVQRWDRIHLGMMHVMRDLKPVCHLTHSEVPAAMKMPRLPARLRTRAACCPSFTFGKALLQNGNDHRHCWVPGPKRHCVEDEGDFLEVDLGGECVVHGVGTRGLFPTHFWYPTAEVIEKEMGLRVNEYRGGVQAVVREDSPMGWVKKYELLYRTDRGTEWISLGIFDGNTNYHEEAVTSMMPFAFPGISGIRVRYLRFRPLSKEQEGYYLKKALRVAIYGHPVSCKTTGSMRNHRVNDLMVAAAGTAEKSRSATSPSSNESATSITYTLSQPMHCNPTYRKRTGERYRCRCSWCRPNYGRTARKKDSRHAAREAIEYIGLSILDRALMWEEYV